MFTRKRYRGYIRWGLCGGGEGVDPRMGNAKLKPGGG
jgi:hypothetical protein